MLEVFAYLARYNAAVNRDMMGVMEAAPVNVYDHPVEGYFKSAGEILDHLYIADVNWLASFRSVRGFAIHEDPLFSNVPFYGSRVFRDLGALKEGRRGLDEIFIRFVSELRDEDLPGLVKRTSWRGEKQERILWKALLHVFNHQTHHRAMVSQILEELRIDNDFASLVRVD